MGSWSIKGNLVNNGRCPKCTLKIPCKHYERVEDLPQVVQKTVSSVTSKALPPLPPPTKTDENIVPKITAGGQRKQEILDSLMQAENDPITASLVQSYLRRQNPGVLPSSAIPAQSSSTLPQNVEVRLQRNNGTLQSAGA